MRLSLSLYSSLIHPHSLSLPPSIQQFIASLRKPDMKSSDAKASKCHLKFSSIMIIFIKLVCLSSVISLKLQ